MRPPLPTLGPQPKKSPFGAVLVISLVLGTAAGGVWWWKNRSPAPVAPAATPVVAVEAAPVAPEDAGLAVAAAPVQDVPPPLPSAAMDPLVVSGLSRASVKVTGPLETAVVEAAGPAVGPALAQVVTRTLVWWVDVPGEILRGDTIDILYETRPGEEPLVHAVRFNSGKTGQVHRAYRFQPQGDAHPRYYLPSGEELELRLEHSPVDDYEQVTSLLRDGRRHKGVDFKTAVGTPLKAPFTGVVKRKNWAFRFNGNCVELQEVGGRGRRALFLHLDELPRSLKVGDRISQGTVFARTGNSGRSFAPHLHYQLETQGDRVLDPFESHRTYRRSLGAAQRPALEAEMQRLDGLLGTATAGR
jgi:murein DD-endopeptidase MepM/ murein hydrolase activator NlpD